MKLSSAPDIFPDRALGLAPPPVWVSIRSVLRNQKHMSEQWGLCILPSNSGESQSNRATYTGAPWAYLERAVLTTPERNPLVMKAMILNGVQSGMLLEMAS